MTATDHLNGKQFYHSTDAKLSVGDHVVPAAELNPKNPRRAQANPMSTDESDPHSTYMADTPGAASRWGMRTYSVKPLGSVFPSETDTGGHDFESRGHLEVTGLAEDRTAKFAAAQKSYDDYQNRPCAYCGERAGSHPTPKRNQHSNLAAQGETGSF